MQPPGSNNTWRAGALSSMPWRRRAHHSALAAVVTSKQKTCQDRCMHLSVTMSAQPCSALPRSLLRWLRLPPWLPAPASCSAGCAARPPPLPASSTPPRPPDPAGCLAGRAACGPPLPASSALPVRAAPLPGAGRSAFGVWRAAYPGAAGRWSRCVSARLEWQGVGFRWFPGRFTGQACGLQICSMHRHAWPGAGAQLGLRACRLACRHPPPPAAATPP